MFKDHRKKNRMSIRKGATAKLLRTFDQKFRILVFTGDDGYLGKGAQGKCYLGILKNEQELKDKTHCSDEEYDSEKIQQMMAAPWNYPIIVVKEITKNDKKPAQQEQYKKEIENLALATQVQGNNNNIVKCYPYILTSEKHFYMVMEYCEGKSLDLLVNKRIHSGKWFNFFEFLKIFKDIVNGYYPLNKVMIMHEDLKPENIFIKGKNFKIGDFGLSFLMKSQKGFSRGGTTSYNGIQKYQMPPVNPSHKSDMYSIGVILHRIFFGFHPYYEKGQLQEYQAKQVQIKAKQREVPARNIVISRREYFEIFVKFYQEQELKQRKSLIKKPQFNSDFYTKYQQKIESLYSERLPGFIRKLVEKNVDQRPSFTQVLLFMKQNKIEQITQEYIKSIKQQGERGEGFFDDLEDQTFSNIDLSMNFTNLGQKVLIEDESEVDKKKANIPQDLLRTCSWNKEKKMALMEKYPKVFQLRQNVEYFNKLTRMLMQIQQEFSEFDLKQFVDLLRRSYSSAQTEFKHQEEQNNNEFIFYEDKKMQVQFVVQKYLLSLLNGVLIECQKQIKLLNETELEIFYKENIDLIIQIAQKNKAYLEGELFLGESDYADFKKSQKDLQRIIVEDFLDNITLDKQNLVFVYYCLTILKIKDRLCQKKKSFVHSRSELKQKNQNNRRPAEEDEETEEEILLEKENVSSVMSKHTKEIPDAFLKEFEETIIFQLKKRNIPHMVNIE